MIINTQEDVTTAVLAEIALAPPIRAFARSCRLSCGTCTVLRGRCGLTEEEFQKEAVGYIVALGQKTTESHNEAVLMSGSLGFSALICLLNNGNRGATETTAEPALDRSGGRKRRACPMARP